MRYVRFICPDWTACFGLFGCLDCRDLTDHSGWIDLPTNQCSRDKDSTVRAVAVALPIRLSATRDSLRTSCPLLDDQDNARMSIDFGTGILMEWKTNLVRSSPDCCWRNSFLREAFDKEVVIERLQIQVVCCCLFVEYLRFLRSEEAFEVRPRTSFVYLSPPWREGQGLRRCYPS